MIENITITTKEVFFKNGAISETTIKKCCFLSEFKQLKNINKEILKNAIILQNGETINNKKIFLPAHQLGTKHIRNYTINNICYDFKIKKIIIVLNDN